MYDLVEGIPVPRRVAGAVGLEICNTRAGWGAQSPKEYLLGYDHLAVWAREAGLVSEPACRTVREQAAEHPSSADDVLRRTLAFREALHAVLVDSPTDEQWSTVARTAEAATRLLRLTADGERQANWLLDEGAAGLGLPLLAAALAGADWLTSAPRGSASACPGEGCGWVFSNRSRRRRWCSMAVCGNRAKVRRHATRTRHAARER